MTGSVGPPLPVELVCPLCKDLADEAVSLDTARNLIVLVLPKSQTLLDR